MIWENVHALCIHLVVTRLVLSVGYWWQCTVSASTRSLSPKTSSSSAAPSRDWRWTVSSCKIIALMKFLLRIKHSCWTLPNSSKFSNLDDKHLLLNYLCLWSRPYPLKYTIFWLLTLSIVLSSGANIVARSAHNRVKDYSKSLRQHFAGKYPSVSLSFNHRSGRVLS